MFKKYFVMRLQCIILSAFMVTSCCLLPSSDSIVRITLLQLNDVYEITPVANGKEGGLARVAKLRQQLLAQNPKHLHHSCWRYVQSICTRYCKSQ